MEFRISLRCCCCCDDWFGELIGPTMSDAISDLLGFGGGLGWDGSCGDYWLCRSRS